MAKRRKINVKKHEQYEDTSFMEDNSISDLEHDDVIAKESSNDLSDESHEIPEQEPQATMNDDTRLGDFLKQSRDNKNLTVSHLAHITKISSRNLEYLEANNLGSLPDRVYVIGYIKNYAKALNLDYKVCLNLLEQEYGDEQELPAVVGSNADENMDISAQATPMNKKNIFIGAITIAVCFILYLFITFSNNEQPTKKNNALVEQREQREQENNVVEPQALSSQTPLKSELNEEADVTTNNDENINTEETTIVAQEATKPKPKEGPKEIKKELNDGKKKTLPRRVFYSLSLPLYTIIQDNDELSFAKNIPGAVAAKHNSDLQNIVIKANAGSSWVTYKIDDQPIKQRKLKPGNYTFLKGREIRVALGNIGVIQLYYNKQPIKIESKTGIKNIIFPQENSSNYKMPLFVYDKDKNSFMVAEDYISLMDEQQEDN
jgi:cytoskeleton protein RodZ